jgi:hypothetical protein
MQSSVFRVQPVEILQVKKEEQNHEVEGIFPEH